MKGWINLPERVGVPGKLEVPHVHNRGAGEHRSGAGGVYLEDRKSIYVSTIFLRNPFRGKDFSVFKFFNFRNLHLFSGLTGKSRAAVASASCLSPGVHPEGMLLLL